MIYARSLLFLLVQVISVIIFTPVAVAAYPFKPVTRSRIIGVWAYFIIWWLKVCCHLRHEIHGAENIPRQPRVILSKHQSAWETIAFQTIFGAQAWVLKKELLWIPFFGWSLALTHPIAIDRKAGIKALDHLVKAGIQRLRGGRHVVVFPEGTRMSPRTAGRYNPGGAMLAVRAKMPVVPVAHNAGSFWPKRGFIKRPGVIQVVIGPTIPVESRRAQEVNKEARTWIENAMTGIE